MRDYQLAIKPEPHPLRHLLDVNAAAEYLGVSAWSCRRWAYEGHIASVKLGSRLMFSLEALDAFVSERTRRVRREI